MRIVSIPLLSLVLSTLSLTAAAQAVWKYVDEKGVTHYTDQPVPGAEKVQMRSGNSAAPTTAQNDTAPSPRAAQQVPYRNFEIVRPSDQGSVVNTGGALQVTMVLVPTVVTGHSISLYLDGKRVEGFAVNTLDFELQNVERGTHTLMGVVTDENDRRILESNKVTFTMRQKSIAAQPPVGPSIRPPPKTPNNTPRAPARSTQPSFADLHSKQAR